MSHDPVTSLNQITEAIEYNNFPISDTKIASKIEYQILALRAIVNDLVKISRDNEALNHKITEIDILFQEYKNSTENPLEEIGKAYLEKVIADKKLGDMVYDLEKQLFDGGLDLEGE